MMTNTSFSARLRGLSSEHFKRSINHEEYRRERKKVLDQIDEYFNGAAIPESDAIPEKSDDSTVPYHLEDRV